MKADILKFSAGIIGAGKLGSALCDALSDLKLLKWILARSYMSQINIKHFINSEVKIISTLEEISSLPQIIIIAVSDSAIREVAQALGNRFKNNLKNKYIIHCSGVLSSDELGYCNEFGAKTASIHPYQTFYYPSRENFKDVMWGIEAAAEDRDYFTEFINLLGGNSYFFDEDNIQLKPLYHSSAVAASNFLTSAIELSKLLAIESKIPAYNFLPPIINTSIKNNLRSLNIDDAGALTGPIARGDLNTIKLHIKSLQKFKYLEIPYIHFALATVELSYKLKVLKRNDYVKIKSYLQGQLQ